MSIKTKSYPNPVLGNGDDYRIAVDKDTVEFSPVEKDDKNFYCTVTLHLEDEVIMNLIKGGKAAFFCDIDCVKTNYRMSKYEFGNMLNLEIPRTQVVDNVDVNCYIVVMEPIENYTHPEFNEMFEGAKFSLEEGDFIATLGSFFFNATIKYNKCPSPSSLMQVKRATQESGIKEIKFSPEEERIFIIMPKELFDIYTSVCNGQNTHAADMFISTIAVDALAYALMTVLDKDTKLAENLRNLMDKNHLNINEENPEQCFDVARKLLENDGVDPYTTFMKNVQAVINSLKTGDNGTTE